MSKANLFYIAYDKNHTPLIYSNNIVFFMNFCEKTKTVITFEVYKLNSVERVIDFDSIRLLGIQALLKKRRSTTNEL